MPEGGAPIAPIPPVPDEELVAAVLRGEDGRFGDLVDRYQSRLVNYLARMVRNVDEAHDLAQEVFLKVYQALDRFDPKYRFSTWIFRVAQNAAIDTLRRQRLRFQSPVRETIEGEEREWEPPSPERGPYGEARNRERAVAIRAAVDELPGEYRELIALRHYAELSYEEIATVKGLPLGTVKNKLFRARQALKQVLADFLVD
jgi:RNA polymerase sigma-70 factor (ECF subfamily)